jgi:GGDEF domain-containing protein
MEELYLRIRNAVRQARYRAGIDHVSGLPGGPLVEAQLKTLLQRTDWAVLLVSVEGFERFERAYGHLVAKFVEYVAQLVRGVVDRAGDFGDFCGRVDVVQYVIVTTPFRVADLRTQLGLAFSRAMHPPVEEDGGQPITAHLSLSFGVITDRDGPFGDVRSLAHAVTRSRGTA